MQNEKTFDTGELTLTYLESGNPAAPPLVVLHGLTSRKEQSLPLFPALGADWHLYAPDLRGHGTSGRAPERAYTNADYARDVIAFLNFIGQPAVLMGHSLGAMTALVAAARHPHLRAVILNDPPLSTWNTPIDRSQGAGAWFQMIYDLNSAKPTLEEVAARVRAMLPPGTDDNALNGMAETMFRVAPGTVKAALDDRMWDGVDLPEALQAIQCPTLLIHGDFDKGGAMRAEDIALFQANCPSATVVRIPGADHGLGIEQHPEVFLGHLNAFLRAL